MADRRPVTSEVAGSIGNTFSWNLPGLDLGVSGRKASAQEIQHLSRSIPADHSTKRTGGSASHAGGLGFESLRAHH